MSDALWNVGEFDRETDKKMMRNNIASLDTDKAVFQHVHRCTQSSVDKDELLDLQSEIGMDAANSSEKDVRYYDLIC